MSVLLDQGGPLPEQGGYRAKFLGVEIVFSSEADFLRATKTYNELSFGCDVSRFFRARLPQPEPCRCHEPLTLRLERLAKTERRAIQAADTWLGRLNGARRQPERASLKRARALSRVRWVRDQLVRVRRKRERLDQGKL